MTWHSPQSKPILRLIASITILCFSLSNISFAFPASPKGGPNQPSNLRKEAVSQSRDVLPQLIKELTSSLGFCKPDKTWEAVRLTDDDSQDMINSVVVFPALSDFEAYINVGQELYDLGIPEIQNIYHEAYQEMGLNSIDELFKPIFLEPNWEIATLLFILHELAYFKYLQYLTRKNDLDFRISALTGSSMGIVTAAIAAGVISLKDYIRYHREMYKFSHAVDRSDKAYVVTLQGENIVEKLRDLKNKFKYIEPMSYFDPTLLSVYIDADEIEEFIIYISEHPADKINIIKSMPVGQLMHSARLSQVRGYLRKWASKEIILNDPEIKIISNTNKGILLTADSVFEEMLSTLDEPATPERMIRSIEKIGPDIVLVPGKGQKLLGVFRVIETELTPRLFLGEKSIAIIEKEHLNKRMKRFQGEAIEIGEVDSQHQVAEISPDKNPQPASSEIASSSAEPTMGQTTSTGAPEELSSLRTSANLVLGRDISDAEFSAIQMAHEVGQDHFLGKQNPDGTFEKNEDPNLAYTPDEIAKKVRILKKAGFSQGEREKLIKYGVAGNEYPQDQFAEYRSELKLNIKGLIKDLAKGLSRPELAGAVQQSEHMLDALTKGDLRNEGYDQAEYVVWHDYTHAVNNTIETLKALQRIQRDIPTINSEVMSLVAIAGMLHDTGYYTPDTDFATIKVDHEQRSKEFVHKNAAKLGLSDKEVALVCLVISATQADVQPAFWNSLQELIEKVLKGQTTAQDIDSLNAKLNEGAAGQYAGQGLGIDINKESDLNLFLGVIYGAKFLAALDIWDTRANAIDMMPRLRAEFLKDKNRLKEFLNINDAEVEELRAISKLDSYSDYLTAKADEKGVPFAQFRKGVAEILKLAIAPSSIEQIGMSQGFYAFYADPRVNSLLGEGNWAKRISQEAQENMNRTKAIVKIAFDKKVPHSQTFLTALAKWQATEEWSGISVEEKDGISYTVDLPSNYPEPEILLTALCKKIGDNANIKILLRGADEKTLAYYEKLNLNLKLGLTIETTEEITTEDMLTDRIKNITPQENERYLLIARPENPKEYEKNVLTTLSLNSNLKIALVEKKDINEPTNAALEILKGYFGKKQIIIVTPEPITNKDIGQELKSALTALGQA